MYGVAIDEVDADVLDFRIDQDETDRLRAALAENDDRPRGLAPFEVNPMGERLFLEPAELGVDDSTVPSSR